jgi:hypothetical protein
LKELGTITLRENRGIVYGQLIPNNLKNPVKYESIEATGASISETLEDLIIQLENLPE